MNKAIKTALFLFLLFLTPVSYGANALLDIGVLQKKDGKAVILIFKDPISKKNRKIRFSGNRLSIILYDFTNELKQIPPVQKEIPALKDFILSEKAGNINITLSLKDKINNLLPNRKLTFLINDPYMLGIMFTESYLNKFKKIGLSTKEMTIVKKTEQQTEDTPVKKDTAIKLKEKVESSEDIKKDPKNEDIELPFIKYEDIFAIPETKETKEKKIQESTSKKSEQAVNNKSVEDKKKKSQYNTKKSIPLLTNKSKSADIKHGLPTENEHLSLLRLITSLSIVLGIVIISLFLWKKMLFFKYKTNSQFIKILGVHYFGTKQFIAVVQVGEEKFLLGITSDNIQLITKLNPGVIQTSYSVSEEDKQDGSVSQKAADVLRKKFAQLKRV